MVLERTIVAKHMQQHINALSEQANLCGFDTLAYILEQASVECQRIAQEAAEGTADG